MFLFDNVQPQEALERARMEVQWILNQVVAEGNDSGLAQWRVCVWQRVTQCIYQFNTDKQEILLNPKFLAWVLTNADERHGIQTLRDIGCSLAGHMLAVNKTQATGQSVMYVTIPGANAFNAFARAHLAHFSFVCAQCNTINAYNFGQPRVPRIGPCSALHCVKTHDSAIQ